MKMKKLNLYSKSNIKRNHLINLCSDQVLPLFFILSIIVYVVSVFWKIPYMDNSNLPVEFLITALKTQSQWDYTNNGIYIFSASSSTLYPLLVGIAGSFAFVYLAIDKGNATMELSLGIKRKDIFINKVIIPLSFLLSAITIVNVIILIINLKIVGYHDILLPAFLGNLLYVLKLTFLGTIVVLSTLLIPKRLIDKAIWTFSAIAFNVYTIYLSAISLTISPNTETERFLGNLSPFTDFIFKNNTEYMFSVGAADSIEWSIELLLHSLVWVIIEIIVILLLGRYFVKDYKLEDFKKKNSSKLAIILPCLAISPIPAIFFSNSRIRSDILYNNLEFYWDEILISLLIIWAVSIVLSIIITWNPRRFYLGAISAGIYTVITLICCTIGITDAFGYAQYVPEPQEIKSAYISTQLSGFNKATDNLYFYSFISGKEEFNIELKTEKDIAIITDIHKEIVSGDELDVSAYCYINYELKDGTVISRNYIFINEAAADEMYRIFETDFAKNFYGQLLNIPEVVYQKLGEDVLYPQIPYNRLTYKNVHVIAKDNTTTCLSDQLTSQQIKELKYALYKDVCSISAEDWYKPTEQYGALAISNVEGEKGKISNTDPISFNNADEHGQFYFFITPEMTNTVEFLKKYDYMKYFELKKQVKSTHVVDIRDLTDWEREFNMIEKTAITEDGRPLCTYQLTWNNFLLARYVEVCVLGNTDYLEKFDPDVKPPETTDIPIEKATEYLEDSFLSYNVGLSGKILATTYTDGTYNTVIIPK